MSKEAIDRLSDELDNLIDHMEFTTDMNYAEAVGVLTIKANSLMVEATTKAEEPTP